MIHKAKLTRREGEDIFLVDEQGREWRLPAAVVGEAAMGESFRLSLVHEHAGEGQDKELARDILDEILQTGDRE